LKERHKEKRGKKKWSSSNDCGGQSQRRKGNKGRIINVNGGTQVLGEDNTYSTRVFMKTGKNCVSVGDQRLAGEKSSVQE